jgi:hypothetical protein
MLEKAHKPQSIFYRANVLLLCNASFTVRTYSSLKPRWATKQMKVESQTKMFAASPVVQIAQKLAPFLIFIG